MDSVPRHVETDWSQTIDAESRIWRRVSSYDLLEIINYLISDILEKEKF